MALCQETSPSRRESRFAVRRHKRRMSLMISVLSFGRTGHESTRLLFGAAAISNVSQQDADRTMELIREHGINHIDTAASYGDAELRLGPWMETHRDEFFLATKTGERTHEQAYNEIQRSLERLRTDHVDLIQLHNLVDEDEWRTVFSPGGALEAVVAAKEEGLVRYVGVTGHGVTVAAQHLRALQEYPFDSVLLPYNFVTMQIPYYAENFDALVASCRRRNIAVQTIKSIALRPWLGRERTRATWYEPLVAQPDIDIAVWWVLGRPGVFLNTVGDVDLLPRVLDAAERFENRPPDGEMNAMLERSRSEPLFA